MTQMTGVNRALRQATEANQIPGVVAIAASGSDVIYQGAFGKRDLGKPDAMTTDSVFGAAFPPRRPLRTITSPTRSLSA